VQSVPPLLHKPQLGLRPSIVSLLLRMIMSFIMLGALEVQQSGKDRAEVVSLSGVFRIIPLKGLKSRLRFDGTSSPKLTKDSCLRREYSGYRTR
jgi:hypothetical protein